MMISKILEVKNKTGLHARPISQIIKVISKYKSKTIFIGSKSDLYKSRSLRISSAKWEYYKDLDRKVDACLG